MVWKYAFDRDKAQILTLHLIKCSGKIEERHVNRKRLITQLKKIRSLKVDRKLSEHIDELERRINELVATEKKIEKRFQMKRLAKKFRRFIQMAAIQMDQPGFEGHLLKITLNLILDEKILCQALDQLPACLFTTHDSILRKDFFKNYISRLIKSLF